MDLMVTSPAQSGISPPIEVVMDHQKLDTLHAGVDTAARHACQALLALESFRNSRDPRKRAAYSGVHALIGDLGSLRLQIDILLREPHRHAR